MICRWLFETCLSCAMDTRQDDGVWGWTVLGRTACPRRRDGADLRCLIWRRLDLDLRFSQGAPRAGAVTMTGGTLSGNLPYAVRNTHFETYSNAHFRPQRRCLGPPRRSRCLRHGLIDGGGNDAQGVEGGQGSGGGGTCPCRELCKRPETREGCLRHPRRAHCRGRAMSGQHGATLVLLSDTLCRPVNPTRTGVHSR